MEGSLGSWTCWEMRWLCRDGRTSEVDWTSRVSPTYLPHHCVYCRVIPLSFSILVLKLSLYGAYICTRASFMKPCVHAMPFSVCATYPASVVCACYYYYSQLVKCVSVCCIAGNTTGATSVFTVFEGHEIMFHVSTLLPFSSGNKQQVGCM